MQHEDGHSQLIASTVPNLRSQYDPAFAFELAVILRDGIHRMYEDPQEDVFYYITLYNDNYLMPAMPAGAEDGIRRGLYKLRPSRGRQGEKGRDQVPRVQLFGSGPILIHALRAQELLAENWEVAADVWSATSYRELRRDAVGVEPLELPASAGGAQQSYLEQVLAKEQGVFVAATDFMRSLPEMIARWVPGGLFPLGTDGFGRSETREALRRHFEVDAECIAFARVSRYWHARPRQAGRGAAGVAETRHRPGEDQPDAGVIKIV